MVSEPGVVLLFQARRRETKMLITAGSVKTERFTHEVAERLKTCERINTFRDSGWFMAYGWNGDTLAVKTHADSQEEYDRMMNPGWKELGGRFFTCTRHGWDCMGVPCPKCRDGDAPRNCRVHGWSHAFEGCPQCAGRLAHGL